MEITTKIMQGDAIILEIDNYLEPERATLLARECGIDGRLRIEHAISDSSEEIIYSQYTINEKNKIISALYPYRYLMKE